MIAEIVGGVEHAHSCRVGSTEPEAILFFVSIFRETSLRHHFAMRRLPRFWAIALNTLLSWLAFCTSKYIVGLVAQPCSSDALPSITRTV